MWLSNPNLMEPLSTELPGVGHGLEVSISPRILLGLEYLKDSSHVLLYKRDKVL